MYAFHAYHAVQNGSKPYKSLNLLITFYRQVNQLVVYKVTSKHN